jgi:hypothetical protein
VTGSPHLLRCAVLCAGVTQNGTILITDLSTVAPGASDTRNLFGTKSSQVSQSPTSGTTLHFYWSRSSLITGVTTLRYCIWPGNDTSMYTQVRDWSGPSFISGLLVSVTGQSGVARGTVQVRVGSNTVASGWPARQWLCVNASLLHAPSTDPSVPGMVRRVNVTIWQPYTGLSVASTPLTTNVAMLPTYNYTTWLGWVNNNNPSGTDTAWYVDNVLHDVQSVAPPPATLSVSSVPPVDALHTPKYVLTAALPTVNLTAVGGWGSAFQYIEFVVESLHVPQSSTLITTRPTGLTRSTVLHRVTAPPFAFTWSNPMAGDHTLYAVAVWDGARLSTSSGVSVSVPLLPTAAARFDFAPATPFLPAQGWSSDLNASAIASAASASATAFASSSAAPFFSSSAAAALSSSAAASSTGSAAATFSSSADAASSTASASPLSSSTAAAAAAASSTAPASAASASSTASAAAASSSAGAASAPPSSTATASPSSAAASSTGAGAGATAPLSSTASAVAPSSTAAPAASSTASDVLSSTASAVLSASSSSGARAPNATTGAAAAGTDSNPSAASPVAPGLDLPATIGVGVGIVAVLALLSVGVVCYCRRRAKAPPPPLPREPLSTVPLTTI